MHELIEIMEKTPIGLVAGGGQFPLLFARAARKRGRKVIAIAHLRETDHELENEVDTTCWVKLGQLGKILKFFKNNGVRETVFAGTITKTRIFKDVFPDIKGLTLWNKIDVRQDDAILRAVAASFEKEGIKVLPSTIYLEHLLFPRGLLSKKKPDGKEIEDIRFGWKIARGMGKLDIGQCVVVKERSVLAVEAIEGTDAAITRGGQLAGGGAVVIKLCKPGQDFRFDLPATGTKTVESIVHSGCAVLAVEAGQSLLFDREEMIAATDKAGIVVVGVSEEADGSLSW